MNKLFLTQSNWPSNSQWWIERSKVGPVLPTFYFESVDQALCLKDGKFKIKGKLIPEKTIAAKLTFPLAYPERLSLTCNSGSGGLLCLGDKEINDTIIMEQKIIYERAEELFILSNFSFDL